MNSPATAFIEKPRLVGQPCGISLQTSAAEARKGLVHQLWFLGLKFNSLAEVVTCAFEKIQQS